MTANSSHKADNKSYLDKAFDIKPEFKKFDQAFDIFNRSIWDDKIDPKNFFLSYDITNYKPKKAEGFDHWDYALRNASWHLADYFADHHGDANRCEGFTDYFSLQLEGARTKVELASAEETTAKVKRAAKLLGAGLVGVCRLDDRWLYASRYDRKDKKSKPLDLSPNLKYAIVVATPMDYELAKTAPSATGGAITGVAYSKSLSSLNAIAQFITNLGFEAHASMNDTGLTIPMAIEAGLGEYGRHGLLITKEFGPRVRIGKIFTDLPLIPDKPIHFGVKEFCTVCRKCSSGCPVKAIPEGEPQSVPPNISSFKHITKWTVNAEKCFKFWINMNTDCAICVRVCPYNKDYRKWWNRLGQKLAGSPLRKFMLWLDSALKFGQRLKPNVWWKSS